MRLYEKLNRILLRNEDLSSLYLHIAQVSNEKTPKKERKKEKEEGAEDFVDTFLLLLECGVTACAMGKKEKEKSHPASLPSFFFSAFLFFFLVHSLSCLSLLSLSSLSLLSCVHSYRRRGRRRRERVLSLLTVNCLPSIDV